MDILGENNNFTLSEDINGPLLAAVIGIEMVAGLITNSFVLILTLCHSSTRKQPTTVFLANMLITSLAVTIFVMPFSIITAASGEWIFGNTLSQKEKICQFSAFMFSYCIIVATESLVLLSFDRFFFIVTSFYYELYMTVNKAVIIVAVSWVLAAILSSPPLFGFGRFEFAYSYGVCVPGYEGQLGYSLYTFLMTSVFVSSIVVTSVWTLCFTRKFLKRKSRRVLIDPQGGNPYAAQERRIIGLFGMLILVHLMCYVPIVSFALIGSFTVIPPIPYAVVYAILLLLTSLIPLVQSYFRSDIRESVSSFCRFFSVHLPKKDPKVESLSSEGTSNDYSFPLREAD